MRQRWRLADIRAEEVAFVLLSSYLNQLDAQASSRNISQGLGMSYRVTALAEHAWQGAPAGSCSRGHKHVRCS